MTSMVKKKQRPAGRGGKAVKARGTWSVADAKARLSEVVERATQSGPQTITRHGKPAVVVVAVEEWERRTRKVTNLAEFFGKSPLRGVDIEYDRRAWGPRKIDL